MLNDAYAHAMLRLTACLTPRELHCLHQRRAGRHREGGGPSGTGLTYRDRGRDHPPRN